jgi:sugar-specific transcriptional regulator TrmB
MPTPHNERHVLERERADLPRHLAAYQGELDTAAPEHKRRRERLAWQIRRVQKLMAEVDALLTGGEKLGHPQ